MSIISKINRLRESELNKRIFDNGAWILLGNLISKFSMLISTIIIARVMDKEVYGQFGIIKSTILMFAMFAGLELGLTATKYISQYRFTDKLKVEKIIGLSNFFAISISLLITVLVFIFAIDIAEYILAPHLTREIRIGSLVLFFSSLNGVQVGILNGLEKFKTVSINNAISGIISSISLIIAAYFFDLEIIVIAFGLNFLILFLLNKYSINKYFDRDFKIKSFSRANLTEYRILLNFSFPAILAGLMVGPISWLCNFILINQNDGYNQMAVFDIANQWRMTVLFIPSALSQIALPMLSSSLNDTSNYKDIFNKNLKINFIISLGFGVLCILFTPLIIWLYGDKYADATWPMIIMFISTIIIAMNNVIGQGIASQDKMWLGLIMNGIWAIVLLLSCYFFVSILQYGAIGVSLSYLLSYIVLTILQFSIIRDKL